jgi:hypothetical protein
VRPTSTKRFPKGFSSGIACLFLAFVSPIFAENAAFDLIGPKVQVKVQRSGKTLPIAEVPNLQAGDRLWVHPDLPDHQSVHYLMVVVFLRGATNPPPEQWFTRAETWTKAIHEEGIFVTVPEEAEEALVLLAPETGGAFSTLRAAVRGKPGAFVRAAQDLEQASLDRLRLERYLEAVRETSASDPEQLKARTTLLARSLNIRLDQQCFDKPSAQQAPCLTQHTEQLVLDDAHSQDMVATLMTGAPTDLLAQLSSTPTARSGYYSPYIGAVVDVARILSTAHTAQYQYIPALALPKRDELNLRLNNPPSFRNPKSVLVIGLPPVRPAVLPPLRVVDAARVFCIDQPGLELQADGAPLVFATELAHNFVLHVDAISGAGADLPAAPDPARGAFVVETKAMLGVGPDGEFSGTLRGLWGFRAFDGPRFRLRASRPGQWTVASQDASALIVGRVDTLRLQSADSSCVSEVQVKDESGKISPIEWSHGKADDLEVKVPLQNASAGTLKLLLKKFGLHDPDELSLHTYAEAARLDAFTIHAGDANGLLKGTRLDEVKALELNGITFTPANLSRANQQDELRLTTKEPAVSTKLQAGAPITAQVTLKDGRTLDLSTAVEAPRPKLNLLSRSVQLQENDPVPVLRLGSPDELPQDARLQFFLKTQAPEAFPPAEKVEVATGDEAFHAFLSIKDGNLTLQDSTTVFAALDPMKLLGPSAFGPLKFRALSAEGIAGDWQPLVTLVRIPTLKGVRCVAVPESAPPSEKGLGSESGSEPGKARVPEKECILSGDKLFLIDAVSSDPDFTNAVRVPDGFMGTNLTVPQPKEKALYIKLRDDPAAVSTAVLPILDN